MACGIGIAQAQHQPRSNRQSRRDVQQFEGVSHDLVLLGHFWWAVMCPCLDQECQILVGTVDLDTYALVKSYLSRTEDHTQTLTQPFEHDPLCVSLLAAVSSPTAVITIDIVLRLRIGQRDGHNRTGRGRCAFTVTATKVIDDLSPGSDVAMQSTRTFQPAADLIDGLTWANAQSTGQFVVIHGAVAPPQLTQNPRCDGRLGHMGVIADR